jgi:hypothetical protein
MTPISIGEQRFIKDINKGWIDSKTKQPADKGLIRLLDSLVVNEPVLKKLRTKIDRSIEPVSFGGQKFVYDVNQGWIDEKTKIPVPPSLQRSLSIAGFGIAGTAGLQQTKNKTLPEQKTGGGTLVYSNVNINKPIVKMIGTLASIDGFLKQRLDNQKIVAKNNLLGGRKSQIENINQQPDMQVIKPDAEKVSGSTAAGALAIGGLLLLTLDPVQEAIKSIVGGVVETGKFITGIVSSINSAFTFLFSSTGTDPTATESPPTATPQVQPQADMTPAPETGMAETTADAEPVTSEEKPSFTAAVAAGAATGAVVASVVPRVGVVAGAVVGGAIAAIKHVSSGGSTPSGSSSSATPAMATPTATTGSTADATPAATTGSAPDATPETSNTGNVVQVNHPETGSGWGIAGATDNNGRPVAFSKEGAEAFSKMMQDSGGIVKPSDIASSKRSVAKNNQVDGAANSPHLRGVAMDIHGSSGSWIRQNGYKYGWKPHDYAGTHGGHFVFGGAGMSPDEGSSLGQTIVDTVNAGAGKLGEIFGMLGSAIIKPGVPRDKEDYSKAISAAAVQTNTESAVAKAPKPTPILTASKPPNINKSGSGATQNAATTADKDGVYYYLRRFGFQELSAPVKPAKVA